MKRLTTDVHLAGIPRMHALNAPAALEATGGVLTIGAGARTDWIINPMTGRRSLGAPAVLFPAAESCMLSAKVSVSFGATFDAGVLVAYQDDQTWAKLCFEYSPQHMPMIVSVVTREFSDDCNSVELRAPCVHLRLAKDKSSFALHYSLDRQYWHFVRLFMLGSPDALTQLGFLAQSPGGEGATATFSEITYTEGDVPDPRSGE